MMKYYSAIKNSEVLLFIAMLMDELESIMLSEISERKTNAVCYYLYMESKK